MTSCQGQTTLCGVQCIDTANDPAHCGACGLACAAGQAWSVCGACSKPAEMCGGRCVEP